MWVDYGVKVTKSVRCHSAGRSGWSLTLGPQIRWGAASSVETSPGGSSVTLPSTSGSPTCNEPHAVGSGLVTVPVCPVPTQSMPDPERWRSPPRERLGSPAKLDPLASSRKIESLLSPARATLLRNISGTRSVSPQMTRPGAEMPRLDLQAGMSCLKVAQPPPTSLRKVVQRFPQDMGSPRIPFDQFLQRDASPSSIKELPVPMSWREKDDSGATPFGIHSLANMVQAERQARQAQAEEFQASLQSVREEMRGNHDRLNAALQPDALWSVLVCSERMGEHLEEMRRQQQELQKVVSKTSKLEETLGLDLGAVSGRLAAATRSTDAAMEALLASTTEKFEKIEARLRASARDAGLAVDSVQPERATNSLRALSIYGDTTKRGPAGADAAAGSAAGSENAQELESGTRDRAESFPAQVELRVHLAALEEKLNKVSPLAEVPKPDEPACSDSKPSSLQMHDEHESRRLTGRSEVVAWSLERITTILERLERTCATPLSSSVDSRDDLDPGSPRDDEPSQEDSIDSSMSSWRGEEGQSHKSWGSDGPLVWTEPESLAHQYSCRLAPDGAMTHRLRREDLPLSVPRLPGLAALPRPGSGPGPGTTARIFNEESSSSSGPDSS